MTGTRDASEAAERKPSSATVPPLDRIWEWFGARRQGTRYQPHADDAAEADLNGCLPKLQDLRAALYDATDASVVGVGCSSGFYETILAGDAVARSGRGWSHATLIDTDARALDDAESSLRAPHAASVDRITGAAEYFRWQRPYDLCLFLSLFHHYDRLGPDARATGETIIGEIGAHCQTMFFETGQTDDTVAGASVWRKQLAMAAWASPTAWLESEVPRLTGYTAGTRLGTNPRTQRHLYAFWHRPTTALAPRSFRLRKLGNFSSGTVFTADAPTLWDARRSATECALSHAELHREFLRCAKRGDRMLTDDVALIRARPRASTMVVSVAKLDRTARARTLATAAYAGCTGVLHDEWRRWSFEERALTERLHLEPLFHGICDAE